MTEDFPMKDQDLQELFLLKYSRPNGMGWGPRLRRRFNYYTPDDYYEAMVSKLVQAGCAWADLGCGREIFPDNRTSAQILADRCDILVGVDPDITLEENNLVHQRVRSSIEDFQTDQTFSLVTLRMVAEHIADPDRTLQALSRITRPGGKVVVFTVNQWTPLALLARFIPFRFHHAIKKFIWKTEEKDTFPVAYRMNSRKQLAKLFLKYDFKERYFAYLDDCRTSFRFRLGQLAELSLWRTLKLVGLRYPENCLLGVYERL
ncbi:MAG TPA: class I SAM-dependent methyltransferase [Gemmataceae bacterium]|nr:class I SAM-dependent methyltransferase [Gemmataceae bacterium]